MRRTASRVRRSASHRGKAASKFQFDVTVSSVAGLKEGNTYFVKWSRGVKVASTKPRTADKAGAKKGGTGMAFEEKLSLLCTLFRDGGINKSNSFEEKEAKLSLISITPGKKGSEKTVAKTHFNLAAFAGVPSATERKAFSLSDKVAVTAVVDCKFLGNASSKSSRAGSAMSGLSGVTSLGGGSSSEEEDDFGDLNVDDIPDPLAAVASPVGSSLSPPASAVPAAPAAAAAAAASPAPPPTPSTPAEPATPATPATPGTPSLAPPASPAPSKPARHSAATRKTDDAKGAKAEKAEKGEKGSSKGGTVAPSRSRLGLIKRSVSKKDGPPKTPRSGSGGVSGKADAAGGGGDETPSDKGKHRSLGAMRKEKAAKAEKAEKATEKADKAAAKAAEKAERTVEKGPSDKRPSLFRKDKEPRGAAKAEALEALRAEVAAAQAETTRLAAQLATVTAATPVDAAAAAARECEAQEAVLEASNARRAALQLVQDNLLREADAQRAELDSLNAALAAAGATHGGGEAAHAADPALVAELKFETTRVAELTAAVAAADAKIAAHVAHAARMKETYIQLTAMYDKVRAENAAHQEALVTVSGASSPTSALAVAQRAALDASRKARSIEGDLDALRFEADALHDESHRLRAVAAEAEEELAAAVRQRDRAVARQERAAARAGAAAAAVGGADTAADEANVAASIERLEADRGALREEVETLRQAVVAATAERETLLGDATASRVGSDVSDAEDDWRERQAADMDERELTRLRSRVAELEAETAAAGASRPAGNAPASGGGAGSGTDGDDGEAVLLDLVATKLRLAEAEEERLSAGLRAKELRRQDRLVQERLAKHASRLEVKLGETRAALDALRLPEGGDGASGAAGGAAAAAGKDGEGARRSSGAASGAGGRGGRIGFFGF